MDHERRRQATIVAAVALGLALVVGLIYVAVHRQQEGSEPVAVDPAGPSATTSPAKHHPHHRHKHQHLVATTASAPGLGGGLPAGGAPVGLLGHGFVGHGPHHSLTATVSGGDPLGRVYYIIPTSNEYRRGYHDTYATSWSLSTTVWGSPRYAVVGVQANYKGTPVSCTISVDGHVTDHRTSRGPYSVIWCVG